MPEQAKPLRMPVKTKRVELVGDYTGFWFELKTNIKVKHLEAAMGFNQLDNLSPVYELLADVVADWNFVDENGKALPKPAKNREVFGELSFDLLREIAGAIGEVVTKARDEAAGGDVKNSGAGSSPISKGEGRPPGNTSG